MKPGSLVKIKKNIGMGKGAYLYNDAYLISLADIVIEENDVAILINIFYKRYPYAVSAQILTHKGFGYLHLDYLKLISRF